MHIEAYLYMFQFSGQYENLKPEKVFKGLKFRIKKSVKYYRTVEG
jgi:hypothetical protein